ncbi:MAG TPA: MFS transporter [Candidatus Bathyarchaeia archaeon]|nr:MFS transporter [Candidatus Bathyarchaeia archaeon]
MPWPTGLRAFRHRDFRLFWSGQLVSLVGTWMQSVGQSWVVLEITGSPLKLGTITALQFGPMLFLSFLAGALADRVRKRRLLLLTQSALMVQAFALAALAWTGHIQFWHIAVLATVYGIANTLDLPARQSFVVQIVGKNDLINAIALNSAVFNGARVVGPAVAGLLVARYGVAIAFLLNGLSFIGVITALFAIGNEGEPRPRGGDTLRGEILQGLQYAWETPLVVLLLTYMLVTSLFVVNFGVVVPLVTREVLHEGAHGFGLLMASLGVGAVIGAGALALVGRGRAPVWVLAGAALVDAVGLMVLGLVRLFWVTAVLLGVMGFAMIVFMASSNTTLQVTVPDALRGRLMGLYAFVFVGMNPFGALFIGSVAERWGVPAACLAGGGIGTVCLLALTFALGRRASEPPGVAAA